jgi:hypothetical protein
MRYHHYAIILLLCICCTENKPTTKENTHEPKAFKADFDPAKSKKYKQILIGALYQQKKDTFLIGDGLNARINFDKNVEMLKAVAREENLEYSIKYDADARSLDKSLKITPSEDNEYADVRFIVTSDSSNHYQTME